MSGKHEIMDSNKRMKNQWREFSSLNGVLVDHSNMWDASISGSMAERFTGRVLATMYPSQALENVAKHVIDVYKSFLGPDVGYACSLALAVCLETPTLGNTYIDLYRRQKQ